MGFLSCIGTLQLSLIKGIGRTGWILKYQLFQQVTTGALALTFAKYGADAVMLAIVIKTYAVWPYTAVYISRILDISIISYGKSLLKPFFATFMMIVVFLCINHLCSDINVLARVITVISLSAFSYLLFTFILSGKELQVMLRILKK
ncbi:polysaccharide biosynthesis C-terminal domain-containing protein [Klebsiella quasipneumoniae]|uniref:polysaccharide biosynthesis C-terminal domain-containing protein n=1 Tax=Klebsiella quasipneumoniae TaxID=1463165 RepID=UPI00388EDDDE